MAVTGSGCGEEDNQIKSTIEKVFTQKVQTLEMLQDSFATQPLYTLSLNDHYIQPKDKNGIYTDNAMEEVALENETIVTPTLYTDQSNDIPLAKIDNFVEHDEGFLSFQCNLYDSDLELDDNTVPTIFPKNKDSGNIANSVPQRDLDPKNQEFEVKIINTIYEGDLLPGEVDSENSIKTTVFSTSNIETEYKMKNMEQRRREDDVNCEEECDEVVNFKLDDDFDYDNVLQTPKFDKEVLMLAKSHSS